MEAKQAVLQALEESKAQTQKELAEAQENLNQLQTGPSGDDSVLESVREEVCFLVSVIRPCLIFATSSRLQRPLRPPRPSLLLACKLRSSCSSSN